MTLSLQPAPDDGHTPPACPDSEQAVLGAALTHPGQAIPALATLATRDLYDHRHQALWDALGRLHEAGDPVTPATALAALNGRLARGAGPLLIADLIAAAAHPSHIPWHLDRIHDATRRRDMQAIATRLHQAATLSGDDYDTQTARAFQDLADAVEHRTGHHASATSWAPLDLTAALAGDDLDPPPTVLARQDGPCLVYAASLHALNGEPGSGKTWLALMACAQELDAGRDVVFIDFEDRPGRVTSRLLALGATPQRIKDGFRYIRPWEPLGAPQGAALDAAAHGCALAVIDGVTEAMSAHGLNPDDNNDVAAFYALIPKRITRQGPAVILIDHVVKDPERQGRWGIGGQHKLAGIDGVSYMVKCVEPFGRGKTGKARISIGKDRPGHVEEHAAGRAIAVFVLESDNGGAKLRAILEPPESAPVNEYGDFRPTVLMERVSKWLEAHPGATSTDIRENVKGNKETIPKAITALIDEGYIEVEDGPRRARFHRVVTPFTQDGEDS